MAEGVKIGKYMMMAVVNIKPFWSNDQVFTRFAQLRCLYIQTSSLKSSWSKNFVIHWADLSMV